MVICLERCAAFRGCQNPINGLCDLHMAQLMPLPLTVSCFSKIQIGFTSLLPAHLGSPGQRAVKRLCVSCLLFELSGWLVGCCLVGWLVGWLVIWLFCCCLFVDWLVNCSFVWLVGWLIGWLFGWLAGWLAGCLFI